jgi:hypothetical protein
VQICVGSGAVEPSSEFCSKITDGINYFATEEDLGVWGNPRNPDEYEPNPFFRNFEGSIAAGNKKNPYAYSYDIQTNAGWVTEPATAELFHVNYSDKKQNGAQAAAGGRYILNIYEEVGLMGNFIDALLSNVSTVSTDSGQFGVQIAIGTSGNIELVQQSKKVFNNPEEYNFLSYPNIWEDDKPIGLFIPAYLVDTTFKDKNGNTNIHRALEFYMEKRRLASESSDPEILRNEKMNYPLIPSDMWISTKGQYFPILEAMDRERELVHNNLYQQIGKPVSLIWDSKHPYGVKSEYNGAAEPFYEFPYSKSMSSIEGSIVIYEEPNYIKGEIPNDMYIFTMDPYVAENVEDGGSLGVVHGWLNPKYTSDGYNGNYMVCSYIGKHPNGKDAYYENVEKLLAYYGNPNRGLWYEGNRGDSVRGFFVRKRKTNLLCLRPNKEKGSSIFDKNVTEWGVYISNKIDKLDMIGDTNDWLLQETQFNGKVKKIIQTIPCIFTIRQIINFQIDGNYDAVSSMIIFPLALKELEHFQNEKLINKNKHNPVSFLSVNPNIFKPIHESDNKRFERSY